MGTILSSITIAEVTDDDVPSTKDNTTRDLFLVITGACAAIIALGIACDW